ncbi:craniofacial development protein 2 [Plakobranchus ocellatus]|uniref:Craniofacial development protein 2 n=1 Tax=Plakobranchus ocellatus TaxID=259542 RepID=A0AAV4C8A1_9GAST|nr:craniofacial development protein 2 [Plakobranchus ocellatus]
MAILLFISLVHLPSDVIRRQWTYKSPGDKSRNKIDYILIQKKFRNAVKTSKPLPEADCDSDHVPYLHKITDVITTDNSKVKLIEEEEEEEEYIEEEVEEEDGKKVAKTMK